MRVRIGKYIHWYSIRRMEDAYLKWRHKKHAWDIDDRDHDWIDRAVLKMFDGLQTVLYYTINQIQKRRERTVRVHVDRWDTWNANETLAHVILPVLEQLRDTANGYPIVDPKDVPANLKPTQKELEEYKQDGSIDDKAEARWDWVIGEMIFAFESMADNSWEEQFFTGESDIVWTTVDVEGNEVDDNYEGTRYYRMDKGPNDTSHFDSHGYDKYKQRIQNGLNLFAKYYFNLWT